MSGVNGASGTCDSTVAATVATGVSPASFSWLQPHVRFVVVLVGPNEVPFGIQRDFLCAKSAHYRRRFVAQEPPDDELEPIERLPDVLPEVFGIAQHFMYQSTIYPEGGRIPNYESLFGTWKLGLCLEVDGLCVKAIEAMKELRRLTQRIPATPLLVQVWKETPKGSDIRSVLLDWTSEYMRSSSLREQFATSLPHEVLTDLVVRMANDPVFEAGDEPTPPSPSFPAPPSPRSRSPNPASRRNVHYLSDDSEAQDAAALKRPKRASMAASSSLSSQHHLEKSSRRSAGAEPKERAKPGPKPILPKPIRRKPNSTAPLNGVFSTNQKLNFCNDLITRMLSGPGFWTRLVGPFKQPVDPAADGVPDYPEKVKTPMDLGTIKAKMERKEYADDDAFLKDMRQIFQNCYVYWKKEDTMWLACEKLEKTFEEKFRGMSKWIVKMEPADRD